MTIEDNTSTRPPSRDDDCGCGAPASQGGSAPQRRDAVSTPARARSTGSAPRPFERNAFFPRKLMEVRHWQAEQDYHRGTRELHTRLATGCGVLCGLEVLPADTHTTVVVRAGVAVDRAGRQIVVPHDVEVDPARLTDECGRATGERLTEGSVTISLCYHECGIDVVTIPAESCDDERNCVPGMILESFSIAVTKGAASPVDDGLCAALWGYEAVGGNDDDEGGSAIDRRARLEERAPRACGCGCEGACVPLATVTFDGPRGIGEDGEGGEGGDGRASTVQVDMRVRTVIRSNRELLELILCLAERLEECCGRPQAEPAPRIADMFPWPAADPAAVIADLAKVGAVEVAFDQPMSSADLDAPEGWLGLWIIGSQDAARVPLVRDSTAVPERVVAPPGGVATVYRFARGGGGPATHGMGAAAAVPVVEGPVAVVAMVRSGDGGVIRAGASGALGLDADRHATHLDGSQRGELWAILPGTKATFGGAAQAVPTAGIPALPTGDGLAEGALHIVLPVTREPEPEPEPDRDPPRLLAVLPTGISARARRPQDAESIELTLSAPVVDAALVDPRSWLRVWEGGFDNGVFDIVEAEVEPAAPADELADGTVVCRFPLHLRREGILRSVIVVLWPEQAPQGSAPVGTDAAAILLDSDWIATNFDEEILRRLWEGDVFPNGLPDPRPAAVPKAPLWDGTPGGLAHWTFFAQNN